MYRVPINFHNRLMQGETPVSYIVVNTHLGYRAYAEKELTKIFDLLGLIADGTYLADGSELAGSASAGVLEKCGRVLGFGQFERSMQSIKDSVLGSYQTKTLQHLTVELDNNDDYFAQLIAKEPFIGRELKYYVGFEALAQSEHLQVFAGIINEMSVMQTVTIEADEE